MLLDNWKRNATVFLACQSLSLFGSSIVQFAIFWHITLTTQSGMYTTVYVLVAMLPTFFLSPMGGVWADKYNRKYLIIISDACIAAVTLGLALLFLAGYEYLWFIYIVAGLRALGAAVQQPAVNAMIPDIVPDEQLTRVNGINGTIQAAINLGSPILAGLLLAILPLNIIFFVDVSTAVLAIIIMLMFFAVPVRKLPVSSAGYFTELRAGLSYIYSQRYLRNFFIFFAALMFAFSAPAFLSPLQVARNFGADPRLLMWIEVAFSLGMIIGGLIMASWGGWKNKITTIGIASIVMGSCAFCLGIAMPFIVYLGFMLIIGVALPLFNTAFTVFLQENVDKIYMGRVFGVMMMITSALMPMAMLVMGPLADIVAIEWIMFAWGAVTTVLALLFTLNKELRSQGVKGKQPSVNEDI